MTKVSICIPVYNQVKYLKKCLDSVLIQDYADYEIIVSDDSTNDDVKIYIESLKNPLIQYYRNSPSLGSPMNWNYAIGKAKGEYIKVLHHDDFLTRKDSLGLFVKSLDAHPESDFAFSDTLVWHVKTDIKRIHSCLPERLEQLKVHPEYLFFSNSIGAPSATIFRRSLSLSFDERLKWLVDVDFYISALRKNKNVVYIDSALICTAHGAEGQVTQLIEYDKATQIKEHVLVMEKIISDKESEKLYLRFFDELFLQYNIRNREEVENYVQIPAALNGFFNEVFRNLNSFRLLKKIKYRLLNSKYNKRYFKIEKF